MLKKNVSLKNYTTFKIGGLAKYFLSVRGKEDLIFGILEAKKKRLPFFILGEGSNVLMPDKGFAGVVLHMKNTKYAVKGNKVYSESGVLLSELVDLSTNLSLSGMEWVAGIPGTVGGAVFGNAGAFGGFMQDLVEEVQAFNIKNGKIKVFNKKSCKFSYKDSVFKRNKNLIILSVVLKLKKGKKASIKSKIKEYLNYRNTKQPLSYPSAGSVFLNPKNKTAGLLIEKSGLRGKKIGNAQVAEKHGNFIINLGGATAKDVKGLIKVVKKKVKDKFGVLLKEEIIII